MINKIKEKFPHHNLVPCCPTDTNLYVTDYTKKTNGVRGEEVYAPTPPSDIDYFTLENPINLNISAITFNGQSFTDNNGNSKSQCECSIFPSSVSPKSWILFTELKYSSLIRWNDTNLNKAIRQLCRTRQYYYTEGIITKANPCYLIACLPMQSTPYANWVFAPHHISRLKIKLNTILRFQNKVRITNAEQIRVDRI